ncbi:MAG: hypothetical protein Q4E75_01190 [bacterium]|nr:hypothetical protein [bacterium]
MENIKLQKSVMKSKSNVICYCICNSLICSFDCKSDRLSDLAF